MQYQCVRKNILKSEIPVVVFQTLRIPDNGKGYFKQRRGNKNEVE